MRKLFLFICFLFTIQLLFAQYTINGNAYRTSCNCYTLTDSATFLSGSVWNNNRIDLTTSFDYSFIVYLGCGNQPGADGIAFMLQPISTSVGGSGGSMGVGGISPSLAVTLDTYQNVGGDNDPSFDHIAIQLNGDVTHNSANTISPTVPVSAISDNVEDCKEHILRVNWNATTKVITVYFDGQQRVNANYDLIQNVFNGNPSVYWGFTGATGGEFNVQRFCTALLPKYFILPNQKKCVNIPIQFFDSTITFGGVSKRYWDFGDGSPIDSVSLNPSHVYTAPGNYVVRYRVIAQDGCESVYTSNISISDNPDADFSFPVICSGTPVTFTDQSTIQFGQIDEWNWSFGTGFTLINEQNPTIEFPTAETREISLWVTSVDGCVSDTQRVRITINPSPSNVSAGPSQSIFIGGGVILQGSASGGTYVWTPPSGLSNPTILNPFANPSQTTIYTLTVENSYGCKASDSLVVDVYAPCLDPAKIFTPNNDGFFDKWVVFENTCVREVEAFVYNRWGGQVYYSRNYKNNWDGNYNGNPLPDATYYYVLNVTDITGKKFTTKGNVTIKR